MFAVFSLSACIYGKHGTEWSRKWCDFIVCLSLELQLIECTLMHDANDLYVKVDHGHILIVHDLSCRTPLVRDRAANHYNSTFPQAVNTRIDTVHRRAC